MKKVEAESLGAVHTNTHTHTLHLENKRKNKENGITLIALIITIIVLLILAGISVSMLMGENGILTQTQKAKEASLQLQAEEKIKIAITGAVLLSKDATLTVENLSSEMQKQGGSVLGSTFPVTAQMDGRKFEVDGEGNIRIKNDEKIESEKVKKLKEVISLYNNSEEIITVQDIAQAINMDISEVETITGNEVNAFLYEGITPTLEFENQRKSARAPEISGPITNNTYEKVNENDVGVTITFLCELCISLNINDLLVLQFDLENGKIYFSNLESLDAKTGDIKVTLKKLPDNNPIIILKKGTIISKKADASECKNEGIKNVINKYEEELSGIKLIDVLKEIYNKDIHEIETKDENIIDISDYESCMQFTDVAYCKNNNTEESFYDLSGKFNANINRKIAYVDWKKIATFSDPYFDEEVYEADPSILLELDPFYIPGSILVSMNPLTGEINYTEEPELSFEYQEISEYGEVLEPDRLLEWNIKDEELEDEDIPTIKIKTTAYNLGIYALFIPKEY